MIRDKTKYVILGISVIIVILISIYIHHPSTPAPFNLTGLKYTDIVHGLFYPIFSPSSNKIRDRWFNESTYYLFRDGKYRCPVPYIDYKFEYPPLIGILWYISTCTGFSVGGSHQDAVVIHYYINSSILVFLYVMMIIALMKIIKKTDLNISGERKIAQITQFLLLVSPSIATYLIYNWDIIAASLAILGVLLYIEKKHFSSGVFLGLSISAKLLTAGVALYVLIKYFMYGHRKSLTRYITGLAVACIVPFATLYIASPIGFHEFINHHLKWYCENCIYMIFIRDIWSSLHSNIYISLMTLGLFLFISLFLPWQDISIEFEYKYFLLAMLALIVFNYKFTPQLLLLITPFAFLSLAVPWIYIYLLSDVSNALIIIFFFIELHGGGNPWTYGSSTQYAALTRNILLLIICLYVLFSIAREKLHYLDRGVTHEQGKASNQ